MTSAAGWLGSLDPLAPPRLAALTVALPALVYWISKPLRRFIAGVGLRNLTMIHGLRIVAVPLFFWYGSRGLLPTKFVERAGWGDLLAGALALAAVFVWKRRAGYWVAHLFGMADFFVAFGTAIALTRHDPIAMHAVTGLPMALIPFFAVGLLATTHVMSYDLLLRGAAVQSQAGEVFPLSSTETI